MVSMSTGRLTELLFYLRGEEGSWVYNIQKVFQSAIKCCLQERDTRVWCLNH